jgi:DNA-binding beta-propeller fold protein YncE
MTDAMNKDGPDKQDMRQVSRGPGSGLPGLRSILPILCIPVSVRFVARLPHLATVLLLAAGCGGQAGGTAGGPETCLTWGGPGRTPAKFHRPRAIAAGADRLYVIDQSGRIQAFDFDGRYLSEWTIPEVNRGYATGVTVRADGCVVVAETHNFAVRTYRPNGELVQSIGREGAGPGEFTYVTDVKIDRQGNLFVSEHGRADRVQKFDKNGTFVTMWGRSGDQPGEFHRPQALAVDDKGAVFVADAANHRIQKFTGDGQLLAVWGEVGREPGRLMYPYGLSLADDGTLFVTEYGNNRVQAFDREGRSVGTWGRAGTGLGELATPWGLAWVPGRGVYVADTTNHRVELFRIEGASRGGT